MANESGKPAASLRSHLGYRLRVVSNAVSHSFARKLAETGVTVAEWVILREMYSGGEKTSPSAIAEMTGLTRGAVSKLMERLLNKGLVSRFESREDRRYQDLKLTAKGLKLVPRLAGIADENDAGFFSKLPKSERDVLMRILTKVADLHGLNKHPVE